MLSYVVSAIIPIFILLIYKMISAIQRVSVFQYPSFYNKDLNDEYIDGKKYLTGFYATLLKLLQVDLNGMFYLKQFFLQTNNKTESIWITVIKYTLYVFFSLVLLGSLFKSFPLTKTWVPAMFSMTFPVAQLVAFVYVLKGMLAIIANLIEYYSFYKFVVKKATKNKKELVELWENHTNRIKCLEQYVDVQDKKSNILNPLYKIYSYLSLNRNASDKVIYMIIFGIAVANSFSLAHILPFLQPNNDDDDLTDEQQEQEENAVVSKQNILPKILLRLLLIVVISLPVMLTSLLILWLVHTSISAIGKEWLKNVFSEFSTKSPTFKQFAQMLSLFVTGKYTSNTSQLHYSFKDSLYNDYVLNMVVPICLAFLYGFLVTVIFASWYESDPFRYKRTNSHKETNVVRESHVHARVKRYTYLSQVAIIFIGVTFGAILISQTGTNGPSHVINHQLMYKLGFGAFCLLCIAVLSFYLFY